MKAFSGSSWLLALFATFGISAAVQNYDGSDSSSTSNNSDLVAGTIEPPPDNDED
jgi:hypothetical protein